VRHSSLGGGQPFLLRLRAPPKRARPAPAARSAPEAAQFAGGRAPLATPSPVGSHQAEPRGVGHHPQRPPGAFHSESDAEMASSGNIRISGCRHGRQRTDRLSRPGSGGASSAKEAPLRLLPLPLHAAKEIPGRVSPYPAKKLTTTDDRERRMTNLNDPPSYLVILRIVRCRYVLFYKSRDKIGADFVCGVKANRMECIISVREQQLCAASCSILSSFVCLSVCITVFNGCRYILGLLSTVRFRCGVIGPSASLCDVNISILALLHASDMHAESEE